MSIKNQNTWQFLSTTAVSRSRRTFGWYLHRSCEHFKSNFTISILTIVGIPSSSTAFILDFQCLTKHEPHLIHISNVFWMSIEHSNKLSHLQYRSIVKNIEV
jgi:hypothetical protein